MPNTSSQKLLSLFASRLSAITDEKTKQALMALGDDLVRAIGAQNQTAEFNRPVKASARDQGGALQVKGLSRLEDVRASGNVSWGQRPFILTGDVDGDGNAVGVLARWNEELGEYEPIPSVTPMPISDPLAKATDNVAGDVVLATWDITRGGSGRSLGQDREGGYIVSAPSGNPSDVTPGGGVDDIQFNDGSGGFGGMTGVGMVTQDVLALGGGSYQNAYVRGVLVSETFNP